MSADRSRVFHVTQAEVNAVLFRHGTLDVKLAVPARPNVQAPHAQDELYIVARGSGVLFHDGKREPFAQGDLLFVAAGVEHHFEEFDDNLLVWRVFYRAGRRRSLDFRSMSLPARPHVLGVDDGPFEKHRPGACAPIVGVMMEGRDLVEAVAITEFPVDGDGVTAFLADWIRARRFAPALDGILFGGITLAGLAVLDANALARELETPVVVVNRKVRSDAPLRGALAKAGFAERALLLESAPPSVALPGGIHASVAGGDAELAAELIARTRAKSDLPEPLRLAHLFAHALVRGESRGRP